MYHLIQVHLHEQDMPFKTSHVWHTNKRDEGVEAQLLDFIASPTNNPGLLKKTGLSSYHHLRKGFHLT